MKGDFKDWPRFWNQFVVKTDRSIIIYLKNKLVKLVERQGKVVILGLPQAIEQNAHVKKISEENYGKDIKVRKVHKQIWAHCLKI